MCSFYSEQHVSRILTSPLRIANLVECHSLLSGHYDYYVIVFCFKIKRSVSHSVSDYWPIEFCFRGATPPLCQRLCHRRASLSPSVNRPSNRPSSRVFLYLYLIFRTGFAFKLQYEHILYLKLITCHSMPDFSNLWSVSADLTQISHVNGHLIIYYIWLTFD